MTRTTAARRHAAFSREYIVDHNGTRAYRAVYPKVKSDDVARAAAARLLARVSVQKIVAQLEAAAAERADVDINEVVRISLALARVDIADIFYPDGGMKPIHEIPR